MEADCKNLVFDSQQLNEDGEMHVFPEDAAVSASATIPRTRVPVDLLLTQGHNSQPLQEIMK
jgi:hypothetical protein